MLPFSNTSVKQKRFIFLASVFVIYAVLFISLNNLKSPIWWDERTFWNTTIEDFSDGLFPSFETLKNYRELNTPLPFVIWGALEYLFEGGIFAGRALNFGLSIVITVIVGYPRRNRETISMISAIGLLICPYYLWMSGHLYTDIIAAFFVLLGFFLYFRNLHSLSGFSLILGIASRQYMLAFPLGIAAHEFFSAWRAKRPFPIRSLMPLMAAASIVGWVMLFGGLAPSEALTYRSAPPVQQVFWALEPAGSLYFLAIVGVYFVIPEYLLFNRRNPLPALRKNRRLYSTIAGSLLVLFIIFPPTLVAGGSLIKVIELLPFYWLKFIFIYGLALITSWRFSTVNLSFWIVLFNALIMLKAFQWDRYVLPLLIVLWYLKAVGQLGEKSSFISDPGKGEGKEFPT